MRQVPEGHYLYVATAGVGALLFFAGPTLALLAGIDALAAASIGYSGIAVFTGGIAARYSFAVGRTPLLQLFRNLLFGILFSAVFYAVFLFLYLI